MEGREVVKQGLIRWIGNGGTSHIWNDPWLPRKNFMRPMAPRQNDRPEMVSELID